MKFLRNIFDNAHEKLNANEKTKKLFPLVDAFDTLMFTPNHVTSKGSHVRDAIELLKRKKVDFDFDGEMQPDVALNPKYKETYPFSKIVGNANILIMPALHSAAISTKLMKTIGGAKIIGPLLIGLGLPIEIAPLRSSSNDILNLASVAAYSAEIIDYKNKKN